MVCVYCMLELRISVLLAWRQVSWYSLCPETFTCINRHRYLSFAQSFVGVAIVLALLSIRKACRDAGFAVGPIVTLSYKNHAEDEFLCDVLRFATSAGIPLGHGALIRCGKPERPELLPYSERHTAAERQAENELVHRLAAVRMASRTSREWSEMADALENRAFHMVHSSELEK